MEKSLVIKIDIMKLREDLLCCSWGVVEIQSIIEACARDKKIDCIIKQY